MPTLSPDRLRLLALEDRNLLSAWYDRLPDDQVVRGTDANDLITLTRLDDDRVQVTVRSFLDPEWTQPTGDPVISFEVSARDIVGVNGGAGHDRVRIVDPAFGHVLLWGTNRHEVYTAPVATGEPDGTTTTRTEEVQGSFWVPAATQAAPTTVTDGAEIADGDDVGVTFDRWIYLDDPVTTDPPLLLPVMPGIILPAPWDPVPIPGGEGAMTEEAPADGFPILDDAVLMIGEWDGLLPAVAIDPGPDGDVMSDWVPDPGDLNDLWAQWADDQSIDPWGAEAGYSEDGSDAWGGESMDDWMVTDLEAGG